LDTLTTSLTWGLIVFKFLGRQCRSQVVLAGFPREFDRSANFHAQEAVMKGPRLRIAWVMAAVAIAALDFWGIREFLGAQMFGLASETDAYLLLGALPMANVLGVGILIGQQRPGSSPFLLGFEIFGALALTIYVVLSCMPHHPLLRDYAELWVDPIRENMRPLGPFLVYPMICFVGVVMLGWPQVAFALFGGLLSRRFRITITPRS
jgi:hypothetical protein